MLGLIKSFHESPVYFQDLPSINARIGGEEDLMVAMETFNAHFANIEENHVSSSLIMSLHLFFGNLFRPVFTAAEAEHD